MRIQFKDLNIKPVTSNLTGDKIKTPKLLNKEVTVLAYKILDSKYKDKGNGKCLELQLELESETYVWFTGSVPLQETILQVPADAFPFVTTITKDNGFYEFT